MDLVEVTARHEFNVHVLPGRGGGLVSSPPDGAWRVGIENITRTRSNGGHVGTDEKGRCDSNEGNKNLRSEHFEFFLGG